MENMERDLTPFIPLQEDELIPLIFQDSDINLDHVLYPNNRQENDGKNGGSETKTAANMQANSQNQLEKKIMHRELERQRRKEMADLYASLRSVLPSKSIKVNGKKYICRVSKFYFFCFHLFLKIFYM